MRRFLGWLCVLLTAGALTASGGCGSNDHPSDPKDTVAVSTR